MRVLEMRQRLDSSETEHWAVCQAGSASRLPALEQLWQAVPSPAVVSDSAAKASVHTFTSVIRSTHQERSLRRCHCLHSTTQHPGAGRDTCATGHSHTAVAISLHHSAKGHDVVNLSRRGVPIAQSLCAPQARAVRRTACTDQRRRGDGAEPRRLRRFVQYVLGAVRGPRRVPPMAAANCARLWEAARRAGVRRS